jgi:hypothetical protein
VLECARYGEDEDLYSYLKAGADVNFTDDSGNTCLHKASANGHVNCLKILKDFDAKHIPNQEGNFPIHWSAVNNQLLALKFLLDHYAVDVVKQNSFGRSTLTEAFQTQNPELIEICLSHSSATEERILSGMGKTEKSSDGKDEEVDLLAGAVVHTMVFDNRCMKIRELPIIRADNPFGTETKPEDDTTG